MQIRALDSSIVVTTGFTQFRRERWHIVHVQYMYCKCVVSWNMSPHPFQENRNSRVLESNYGTTLLCWVNIVWALYGTHMQ